MSEYMCYAELVVGLLGFGFGVWSEVKRKGEREWIHMALVNLKPSIQGSNKPGVIAAINNMLEFLNPPKNKS
jgi:hypothetical protein